MSVMRGSEHVLLGINTQFWEDNTVNILIKDYLEETITNFGKDISSTITSPARNNLYIINECSKVLGKNKGEIIPQYRRPIVIRTQERKDRCTVDYSLLMY